MINKLKLTWIDKCEEIKVEPSILIEDKSNIGYCKLRPMILLDEKNGIYDILLKKNKLMGR